MELMVAILLILFGGVKAQGYNGCTDSDWRYNSHTHTCFKLVKERKTWFDARDACKKYYGGQNNDTSGRLAKIDDEETNRFVTEVLDGHGAYIGLSNTAHTSQWRWDGFSTKEPKFLNFRKSLDMTMGRQYFVYADTPHWRVKTIKTWNKYFVCETDGLSSGVVSPTPNTNLEDQSAWCRKPPPNSPFSCRHPLGHNNILAPSLLRDPVTHKGDISCRILHDGQLTDSFEIKTGVRQRCLLSPFLFILANDWLMK